MYEFVIICRGVVTLSISTGYFVDDICISRWYVLIVHLECDVVVVRDGRWDHTPFYLNKCASVLLINVA